MKQIAITTQFNPTLDINAALGKHNASVNKQVEGFDYVIASNTSIVPEPGAVSSLIVTFILGEPIPVLPPLVVREDVSVKIEPEPEPETQQPGTKQPEDSGAGGLHPGEVLPPEPPAAQTHSRKRQSPFRR